MCRCACIQLFHTELRVCCMRDPGERTVNQPAASSLTGLTSRCRFYGGDEAGGCGLELVVGTAILSSSQGSLLQRVTFQCGPEGGEGGSHKGQELGKSVSGRERGSKGPRQE